MTQAWGIDGAIAIYQNLDAEFIDALIFSWNERSRDPEERLSEYLLRCADEHYKKTGREQLLRDLGIDETMIPMSLGKEKNDSKSHQ